MRIITLKNPVPLATPFTLISTDYTGGISLLVEDSSNFYNNDLILVGGLGNEKAETTDLTANPASKVALAVSAMSFGHNSDESVEKVNWDKFDLQYLVGGTWTDIVTAQPFDWGKTDTSYVHTAGASTDSYRSRFYNSALATYSDWSGTVGGTGLSRLQVGSMIHEVRVNARDLNDQKATDQEIIGHFNACQDIVKLLNQKFDFLNISYTFATIPNIQTYLLPTDCRRVYRLKYTNVESATNDETYHLTYKTPTDFDALFGNNLASTSDDLVNYTVDWETRLIRVGPVPKTAQSLELKYQTDIDDLSSYTDATVIPLPELLINYATWKVCISKGDDADTIKTKKDLFTDSLAILRGSKPRIRQPSSLKRWKGHRGFKNTYASSIVRNTEDYYDFGPNDS
jgi:hypothetical protein